MKTLLVRNKLSNSAFNKMVGTQKALKMLHIYTIIIIILVQN